MTIIKFLDDDLYGYGFYSITRFDLRSQALVLEREREVAVEKTAATKKKWKWAVVILILIVIASITECSTSFTVNTSVTNHESS